MKKIGVLILAALCALLPVMSAAAQDSTMITTIVPDSHTIAVDCGEGGSVTVDGQTHTGRFSLVVDRLDGLSLRVVPDEGWALNQIAAESADGVQISADGSVTLSSVHDDKTLSISFYKLSSPTPTATAKPTATASQGGSSSGSGSQPTATPAATEAAVPVEPMDNVLYDRYLGTGTGEGLGQLSIVFDAEYAPEDYELLPIVADDELLVCAKPDLEGNTAHRSLILSALQFERFHLDSALDTLLFRNGDMTLTASIAELYTGRMAKLIAIGLDQNLAEIDLDALVWDELPEPELTAAQLARARIEVCIAPVALADGRDGYSVRILLRMRNERLDVSALVESLAVNLDVGTPLADESLDLSVEENLDALARLYSIERLPLPEEEVLDDTPVDAIEAQASDGTPVDAIEAQVLESTLRILPEELPKVLLEEQGDASERFDVTIPDDASYPIVLFSMNAALRPYRTAVLTAPYAGSGAYVLKENEIPTAAATMLPARP